MDGCSVHTLELPFVVNGKVMTNSVCCSVDIKISKEELHMERKSKIPPYPNDMTTNVFDQVDR